jgi:hypothetical protein
VRVQVELQTHAGAVERVGPFKEVTVTGFDEPVLYGDGRRLAYHWNRAMGWVTGEDVDGGPKVWDRLTFRAVR